MPAGRPRKPKALKVAAGTFRTDRDSGIDPPSGLPDCPTWLRSRDNALEFWNTVGPQLDSLDLMSSAYSHAFAMACDCFADWMFARQQVEALGSLEDSPTGAKVSGAMRLKNETFDRLTAMLREFGLPPSSITGVTRLDNSGKEQNPMAKLMGG